MTDPGGTQQPGQPGQPAPGWYHDPHGHVRWWDGTQWTEDVRMQETEAILPPLPEVPAVPERRYWPWLAAMLLALVVLVGGALLIVGNAKDDEAAPTDVIPSGEVSDAQASVRSAQTALESYALDHEGSYAGATPESLAAIEPTLQGAPITVSGQTTGYVVSATAGDVTFTITRQGTGVLSYTCSPPGSSGCDQTGSWGQLG
jgi:uncharacterized protein DUF2510